MHQWKFFRSMAALAGVGLSLAAANVRGAYVNLSQTGQTQLNDAWFFVNDNHDPNPSTAFVRIQAKKTGIESGYNNNGPVSADTKSGSYLLKLSQIPLVQYDGKPYFRFVLDVGEPQSASKKGISLDALKLYTFPMTPGNDTKNFGQQSGLALRFDLDGNGNNGIGLSDRTNGQGKNDLVAFLPSFYSNDDQWVMLYSSFGAASEAEGSFEAWKIGAAQVVPEPATMLLVPTTLLLLLGRRRPAKRV